VQASGASTVSQVDLEYFSPECGYNRTFTQPGTWADDRLQTRLNISSEHV